ncbi:MAG: hypothetical protein IJ613_06305, partial [Muribaculaceae bacterium]|nr:hypothetical protein [Muribaculaceae bacterium]
ACGLPPFQGLFVCFVAVTGVALTLHPGLWSVSPFRACSLFAVRCSPFWYRLNSLTPLTTEKKVKL